MGNQKMLVQLQADETRIALTEDDRLIDLHVEQTDRERTAGNIYFGVVVKVNPAFQAAFIDYGEKRNGFLSLNDVNQDLFKNGGDAPKGGRPKIQSLLKSGQTMMVQVLKEGMGDKGASLTTFISLPGRYLVMMPNSDRSGVSRKIDNADKRHELREILNQLSGKSKTGVIIRTAGIERPPADLKRDFAALQKEWKAVEQAFKKQAGPGLLFRQPKSTERVLRDYFTENVKEVWVDSAEAFQEALRYIKAMLPRYQKRLKLYVGDKSLFSTHNVEAQIEALDARKMPLPSGGSIIIESTEALVSIDVNSGKSNQASDIEATALRTNLEAADEAGRQLRLRNLGGLIVIDFIDMNLQKNRSRVEKAMAEALSQDKARTTIGSISQFGLLELSRQRIDMELTRGLRMECSGCGGTGFVPTVNTGANNVLRKIRELAASGEYSEIRGELPLEYANFPLNNRRESLRDLELEFGLVLHLVGNPALPAGQPIQLNGVPMGEAPAKLVTGEEERIDSESGGEEARSHRRRRRRRPPRREGESEIPREPAEEPDNGQTPWPEAAAAAPEEEFDEVSEEFDEVGEEAVEAEGEGEEDLQPSAPDEISDTEPVPVEEVRVNTPPTLKGWKFPQIRFKTARRGAWLNDLGVGVAAGETVFQSQHKDGDSGFLLLQTKRGARSPFAGAGAEEGEILFTSAHLGEGPEAPAFSPSAEGGAPLGNDPGGNGDDAIEAADDPFNRSTPDTLEPIESGAEEEAGAEGNSEPS